jgi:hypothetical protein
MPLPITYHRTKSAAIAAIKANGYTVHVGSGQCGNYAWGSREYFNKPETPDRQQPAARASRVGKHWAASYVSD